MTIITISLGLCLEAPCRQQGWKGSHVRGRTSRLPRASYHPRGSIDAKEGRHPVEVQVLGNLVVCVRLWLVCDLESMGV